MTGRGPAARTDQRGKCCKNATYDPILLPLWQMKVFRKHVSVQIKYDRPPAPARVERVVKRLTARALKIRPKVTVFPSRAPGAGAPPRPSPIFQKTACGDVIFKTLDFSAKNRGNTCALACSMQARGHEMSLREKALFENPDQT